MWRSKMAARWRRKDGNLNTGNSKFVVGNIPNELELSRSEVEDVDMDVQSCVDHSILAIFEDSTIASKSKNGVEEESETLLSALTEMLDSVEDDDGTLSPFDALPDSELLGHSELRDETLELQPRPKPPHVLKTRTGGENDWECKEVKNGLLSVFKKQKPMVCSKTKTAEPEVEVFTSTSLVSLVKLMHPYCLKLHIEDRGEMRKNHSLFSQEEVWRYERPNEESNEEINVVSDDEAPVTETKEVDEVDDKRDNGQLLKSVLLNGNSARAVPPREKKRVSFGPVQVALFESVEKGLNEKSVTGVHTSGTESNPMKSTEALESPAGSALKPPIQLSERNETEVRQEKVKGETKAKSLSLQQYRQLRQTRRPLVEKQGNYTTKWPSFSEPPKELTPIFCFQGQKNNISMTQLQPVFHKPDNKTHHSSLLHTNPSEVKLPTHLNCRGLKCPKTESKVISPASPLPDFTTNTDMSESEKSSSKKPKLLSSDPPNPVLLPLPVPQTPSTANPSKSRLESVRPEETQHESSAAAPQEQVDSSGPKPPMSPNKDCNLDNAKFTEVPPDVSSLSSSQTGSKSESSRPKTPQSQSPNTARPLVPLEPCFTPLRSQPLPHTEAHLSLKELPDTTCSSEAASQTSCRMKCEAVRSGIEAPDLTSLLEQFEETQAIKDRVNKPKLISAASPSTLQTEGRLDRCEAAGPESLLSPAVEATEPLMWESVDMHEPLCTEIILSTQPARRKNLPPKAIQIIDPRPLPSRKTHIILSESPATHASTHMYSYLSTDHDYCGPVDHSSVNAAQHRRAKSSSHMETAAELQAPAQKSRSAGEEQNNAPNGPTLQCFPEPSRIKAEADLVTETAPCSPLTPPPSPPARGRARGRASRKYRRSPQSDSSSSSRSSSSSSTSSSASRSPKRLRLHRRRSESSSCSSSPSYCISHSPPRRYRLSYPRSRFSRSRSPCRARSPSPQIHRQRWREVCSSRESRRFRREHEVRIQKLKAIDERRVVYVGRIRRTMTNDELRERFSQFGEVECVSLHFRDQGDHYGFVTFYNTEDAFAAIDNGGKIRKSDELPFDICFGGRREFCNSDYTDLDANRDADLSPSKSRFEDLDFDSLLKQAQKGLRR